MRGKSSGIERNVVESARESDIVNGLANIERSTGGISRKTSMATQKSSIIIKLECGSVIAHCDVVPGIKEVRDRV